jgi:hypothetical protein
VLLAALFIRTFIGVVRTARSILEGRVAVLSSIWLVPRIAFLGLIAWVWVSWVIDQMPCFLGARAAVRSHEDSVVLLWTVG